MTLYLTAKEPDGTDCETCGWNDDSCEIGYEGNGVWELQGRWGCYSGDHFEGSRSEMIAYLGDDFQREWGHLFTRESIKRAIKDLKEA